jgi:D-glycero-D-manno-heptose 1,7-bisphosphate phosphatase
MNKALFLDRDGVINRDDGYTHIWSPEIIMNGIIEVIKKFRADGYLIIIITNQSGISRGYYSEEDFHFFMKCLLDFMKKNDATIDHYYYCGCGPSELVCPNRKPNPGMFYLAEKDYNIDLPNSFMIGDQISDMIAADRALIKNKILFSTNQNSPRPNFSELDFYFTYDLSNIFGSDYYV